MRASAHYDALDVDAHGAQAGDDVAVAALDEVGAAELGAALGDDGGDDVGQAGAEVGTVIVPTAWRSDGPWMIALCGHAEEWKRQGPPPRQESYTWVIAPSWSSTDR